MASTSDPKFSLLVVLLEEELTYGLILSQKITFKELLAIVKRKLNIGSEFDVRLSYNIREKTVYIVDDDDVVFFVHEVCKHKSELQNLFVSKTLNQSKVTCSSSKPLDFDLNVYPEGYNDVDNDFENIPKKPKKEYFPNNLHDIPDDYSEPKWKRNTFTFMPTPPDPPKLVLKPARNITEYNSYGLYPGRKFISKQECMYKIGEESLIHSFEYKPRKSDKFRYDVKCVHPGCDWVIITAKVEGSSEWEIRTVRETHTCSRTKLIPNHRNATAKLLGHLIVPKIRDSNRIYKARDIVHDMKLDYNCDISYKKAWRGRDIAFDTLNGCPKNSFAQLPYFCHNLHLTNEGWATNIMTDDEDRFEMFFMGIGVSVTILFVYVSLIYFLYHILTRA